WDLLVARWNRPECHPISGPCQLARHGLFVSLQRLSGWSVPRFEPARNFPGLTSSRERLRALREKPCRVSKTRTANNDKGIYWPSVAENYLDVNEDGGQ